MENSAQGARVYFAGVNQHQWLEAMRGRHILESFADVRPLVDRYRPTWASAILDSGAYSAMTQGEVIDIGAYREFAQQHGDFYDIIVNLDDIEDVDRSLENLETLVDAGLNIMPVFHQGEPWSVLDDYCADFDYVGLGFQRPIRDARRWLDDVFERVGDTRIHGFAMTSYMVDWPFHSVDSTSWLYEVRGLMSVSGQGADALRVLTPVEILEIIVKKYERLPRAKQWAGRAQMVLPGLEDCL